MNAQKTERISGVVVKAARKYLYVHLDTHKNPDFTQKLLICDDIKALKPGDRFENLEVSITWDYGYNSGKPFVDHYSVFGAAEKEEARKSSIAKWWGYVLENYDNGNGYIYEKGVAELKRLGAEEELAKLPEMEKAVAESKRITEIKRWWGYVQDAYSDGRIYERGVDKLRELGADEYLEKIPEMRENLIKKDVERAMSSTVKSLAFSDTEGRFLRSGMLIVRGDRVYRVNSKHYQDCDGFSFGAMSEAWYSVSVSDVTDTQEGIAEKQRVDAEAAAENERREKAKQHKDAEQKIIAAVTDGERIADCSITELEAGKEVIWNTFNIYGGGDELLTDAENVYYIRNNGMDGDDWGANNIRTGGAGAYGYYCRLTPEILAEIEVFNG